MTDIAVDFHATPEEILDFVTEQVLELELYITICDFSGIFSAQQVDLDRLASVWPQKLVYLTTTPPDHEAPSQYAFLEKNCGLLFLYVGSLTENGLLQSRLSSRCFDDTMLEKWKVIAKRIKKITKAGVWIIKGGDHYYVKNWRFTDHAMQLQQAGTPMIVNPNVGELRLGKDSFTK